MTQPWIEYYGAEQFIGHDLAVLSDDTKLAVVTDLLYPKFSPAFMTVGEAKIFDKDTIRRYRIFSLVGAETSQEAQAVEPVIMPPITEPESLEQEIETPAPKAKGRQKLFSDNQE